MQSPRVENPRTDTECPSWMSAKNLTKIATTLASDPTSTSVNPLNASTIGTLVRPSATKASRLSPVAAADHATGKACPVAESNLHPASATNSTTFPANPTNSASADPNGSTAAHHVRPVPLDG